MTQLVKELVLYMQELQDNYNDSTKKTETKDDKSAPSGTQDRDM